MGKNIYDKSLDEMVDNITAEIEKYSTEIIKHIKKLSKIGIALSSEKNIDKVLEMIVEEAKNFTNADAGTLYFVKDNYLRFEILFNDTMGVKLGGTTDKEIDLPPVPIEKNTVSGYVAKTGEIVNINDVYQNDEFDFTGTKKYDQRTGYRSKSFLCVPMRNHEDEIIGVLQLLNAKNSKTGEVISFAQEYEDMIFSLASQAAITISRTQLINDIENLLKSFVKVMATAIDERSPYNRKHTARVAKYTINIAKKINEITKGKFSNLYFTNDQIEQLNMAAWLHDVGKVTTPEHIMNKSTKLEKIFDGIKLIEKRFELFEKELKIKKLENNINEKKYKKEKNKIEDFLKFIKNLNKKSNWVKDKELDKLDEIYKDYFIDSKNEKHEYLTEKEYEKLKIRKGNLTEKERKIMMDHVVVTKKMLEEMSFSNKYKDVPEIAASHHEKLNGEGYPNGLEKEQIPIGGKIMAVADFFDALTASDRPYKKKIDEDKAFKILESAAEENEIDEKILNIFRKYKLYEIDIEEGSIIE